MKPGPDRILILAGSRGPTDPLAQHAGVSHKCLIPIDGAPMIERVVGTLLALATAPELVVAIERADALDGQPQIEAAIAAGRLRLIGTAASPSRTVLAAIEGRLIEPPFLIATADHPLLTAEMVNQFWDAVPPLADAAAAVASGRNVRRAWPHAKRTFLRFRDGSYCGCNLFAVMSARAAAVIEFWQQAEARRKAPAAMIRLLGPGALLRFLIGSMSLEGATRHLGSLTGTRLAAVTLPFPEAAVDVDKPEDIALAQQILVERRTSQRAAAEVLEGG